MFYYNIISKGYRPKPGIQPFSSNFCFSSDVYLSSYAVIAELRNWLLEPKITSVVTDSREESEEYSIMLIDIFSDETKQRILKRME